MKNGVMEIVGFFLLIVGCIALVVAAAMVSAKLAVLVVALLLILGGVIAVYVASELEKAEQAAAKPKTGPGV